MEIRINVFAKIDIKYPKMFMDMHKLTPAKYKDFLKKNYNPELLEQADLTFKED